MADRLQRILQRQQEREAKMKEADAKLAAQKKAEQEKKMQEKHALLETLKDNREHWHKEDMNVVGFRGADGLNAVAYTIKSNRGGEKEIKQLDSQRVTDGTSAGLSWVRTPYGWERRQEPQTSYKPPCTLTSLPSWLYDQLDIYFGLRRTATADFADTCKILSQLYHTYGDSPDTSMSVRKKILIDISIGITRIQKCPEFLKSNDYHTQACDLLLPLREQLINKSKYGGFGFSLDDTVLLALEDTNNSVDDYSNICHILPPETIMHICSFLDPKGLCYATSVCYLWSVLGNDDSLYQTLLYNHFSMTRTTLNSSFKDTFINKWTGQDGARGKGLVSCSLCHTYHWEAKRSVGLSNMCWHRSPLKVDCNNIVNVLRRVV